MPAIFWGTPDADNRDDLPTLDHITKRADGGEWARHNLRLVHNSCNRIRG
jgi:5-methylcytosine-specific restriction endonuclease McrA